MIISSHKMMLSTFQPTAMSVDTSTSTRAQQHFFPGQQSIFGQPEYIQDLQLTWEFHAFAWENEEASMTAAVWFVDHSWHWPHHDRYRTIHLYADFSQWERIILGAWHDYIQPGAPYEICLVTPAPPSRNNEVSSHIVIVQHPRPDWVTSVVTVQDEFAHGPGSLSQWAITTHEHILLDNLLLVLGRLGQCTGARPQLRCQAWYNTEILRLGRPIPGRSGYGIIIQLSPITQQPHAAEAEGPVLLQLSAMLSPAADPIGACERLTTDAVAHGQWPQAPEYFPTIGEQQPADWKNPNASVLVQVLHDASSDLAAQIPTVIELPEIYTAQDAESEMAQWGLQCKVFLCGEHDTVFAHFSLTDAAQWHYVYCGRDLTATNGVILQSSQRPLTEIEHMKFLCHQGFIKAVLTHEEPWMPQIRCIHFEDVRPQQESRLQRHRSRTPSPAPQPQLPICAQPFPDLRDLPQGYILQPGHWTSKN